MGAILLASQTRQMAPDCTKNTALVEYDRATETAEKCGGNGAACNVLHRHASNCPAEREGFEPSVQLPAHRFSRPAHSAALAPLRRYFQRLTNPPGCADT
jgi:hypothetical protein